MYQVNVQQTLATDNQSEITNNADNKQFYATNNGINNIEQHQQQQQHHQHHQQQPQQEQLQMQPQFQNGLQASPDQQAGGILHEDATFPSLDDLQILLNTKETEVLIADYKTTNPSQQNFPFHSFGQQLQQQLAYGEQQQQVNNILNHNNKYLTINTNIDNQDPSLYHNQQMRHNQVVTGNNQMIDNNNGKHQQLFVGTTNAESIMANVTTQQQQQHHNNGHQQNHHHQGDQQQPLFDMPLHRNNNIDRTKPYVEIVEQPAKCSLRFRYKCEGRSAGSLPGVNSTADNKTNPSIRIANYVGRAAVVISCVTKDAPYRAHPHNIVGKEGCKKGICTIVINNEPNTIRSFSSLGIQCVKRKDIEESLALRESIKVDPFRNGFSHKSSPSNIDLNVVRLCFQVFIEGSTRKCDNPLTPVVSDPIHDKKAMSDLVITKLSHCSAPVTGGREIILLCDRISKDDIQIRFYEERDNKLIWETYTDISPTDVHKQVAICFKTPKYYNENITQPVMVHVQLKRVSDNQVSEPRLFQFLPCESDEDIISRKRKKIEWVNKML